MSRIGFIRTTPSSHKKALSNIIPMDFTHACAIGETGCGKTTSFIYPNLKDRISKGHGILMFDFKGKEHLALKHFAKEHGRLEEVVELGKPWSPSINLLDMFTGDEFYEELRLLLGGLQDDYWTNLAATVGVHILKTLRAIEHFEHEVGRYPIAYDTFLAKHAFPLLNDPNSLAPLCTFKNLFSIVSSIQEVDGFIRQLESYCDALDGLDFEQCVLDISPEELAQFAPEDLVRLVKLFQSMHASVKNGFNGIKSYKNASRGSSDSTIKRLCENLVTAFKSAHHITTNPFLHSNDVNIASLLNEGKIIVFDTSTLNDAIMGMVLKGVLKELCVRSTFHFTNPISIFIDEAQKVLRKEVDLHADVLRESKTELILAYQNPSLMINKLGVTGYEALKGNLVHQYYYRNVASVIDPSMPHTTQSLKTFEVTDGARKALFDPIFLNEEMVYETENAFQTFSNVFSKMGCEQSPNTVLIAHWLSYSKHMTLPLYDYVTKSFCHVRVVSSLEMHHDKEETNLFYEKLKAHLVRSRTKKREKRMGKTDPKRVMREFENSLNDLRKSLAS